MLSCRSSRFSVLAPALGLLCTLSLAWSQTSEPAQAGSNLILNGNFAQGLAGWKLAGSGSADLFSPDSIPEQQALRTTSWAWVQQDLNMSQLAPGRSYRLSARAKNWGVDGCILGIAAGDSRGVGTRLEQRVVFRGDWNSKTSLFTLPSSAQWAAVFLAGTGQDCLFDDIQLLEAPQQAALQAALLTNGGFEKGFAGWEVLSGELMRGVGLEGKQSLMARGNTRLEQVVPGNEFAVGALYELQASVSKNSGKGECRVGYSGASINGQLISEAVVFDQAMPLNNWVQKSTGFSISEDTAYITVFIVTKDSACSFDSIRIVQK